MDREDLANKIKKLIANYLGIDEIKTQEERLETLATITNEDKINKVIGTLEWAKFDTLDWLRETRENLKKIIKRG